MLLHRYNILHINLINWHSLLPSQLPLTVSSSSSSSPSSSSSSSSDNVCATVGFQKSSVMSSQIIPEHVCYVHCNFCNTILAVSVPGDSLFNVVTVRCGHCANLLSVNMGSSLQALPHQDPQPHNIQEAVRMEYGSSSRFNRSSMLYAAQQNDQQYVLPLRPPEKRQRVPSAYNRFIKEEIQRIKANNPDISHREAFSAAAKNWAHFPHIHFGLTLESGNQQAALTDAIAAPGGQKAQGIC